MEKRVHLEDLKVLNNYVYLLYTAMFKRYLLLLLMSALFMGTLESCFLFRGKNKCDSCPGILKYKKTKKVRKASKGSI
ncbi:MAG: hypothetical protein K0S32_2876 [Bacteroidetes bacterium]|jgi:hypothetical protein|nr:hypothetical protein [Bacteroidota bacterium]